MITSMHIENFKCFEKFDIELGKFNVLVGPNDSGKTAFLEAVRLLSALPPKGVASASVLRDQTGISVGPENIWRQEAGNEIRLRAKAGTGGGQTFELTSSDGKSFASDITGQPCRPDMLDGNWKAECFSQYIGKASYYQFEPDALRKPSRISAKMTQTGEGFPTFLGKIGWGPEGRSIFLLLEKEFYKRFPYYRGLEQLTTTVENDKDAFCLRFHTVKDEDLSADGVSDGVMLSLAFIALPYSLEPPKILLIEEPENGVHYASLKEIISTLRELSEKKDVQIILTTHSPYLLDLVEPEEVHVFAKDEDGAVHAAKLSDHPEVEDLKKHFMTGEIWSGLDDVEVVEKCGGDK